MVSSKCRPQTAVYIVQICYVQKAWTGTKIIILKQLLVTNCEDAGFIFKQAKIVVNNVMQPTKNRKGLIQCRAT